MKKKRINKNLLFMILLICITIGYAYLNSELKINGTTGILGNTWDVHFENVVPSSSNTITPTVAPIANPSDKVTNLTYEITFNKPGDVYEFNVDIVNAGSIDAMIKLYTSTIKVGNGEVQNVSAASVPNYLYYYVTYEDGIRIDNNQILNASNSETITVHIEYKMDINETQLAASSGKTIEFNVGIDYTQKNEEGVEKPGSLHCTYEGTLYNGVTYTNGQYTYTYNSTNEGWSVTLTDKNSTTPVTSKLCATVNNKPIIDMSGMFYGSKTTSIDTSSFNTSKVTNMANMFYNVKTDNLNVSSFNTSNVEIMYGMFNGCSELTELDLSGFNTSKVTNMNGIFDNMSSIEDLYIGGWDFSKINNFYEALNFDTLSTLKHLDISKSRFAVNMNNAFGYASNLESIDVSDVDTSLTTNMSYMFRNLPNMTSYNLSSFDTSKVTTIYGLLYMNTSLKNIDLSSFDTSNVTDMWNVFGECSSLESINISNWDMRKFNQVSGFGKMIGGSSYSVTTSNFPKLKRINASNMKLPNNWQGMFAFLQPVEELIIEGIDSTNVTSMAWLFQDDKSLKSIDLSGLNTSSVTTMESMFYNTNSLSEIDLSTFNLSSLTNHLSMFQYTGATTGYARTQAEADLLNSTYGKPSTITFVVKP